MAQSQNSTPPLPPPGYDLLTNLAIITESIATNLKKNRLGRKSIQLLLREYASRAESDGQLLYTARVNQCVDHALSLAQSHLELVIRLVSDNYNLSSTSVKWYSYKMLCPRNQLPLFCVGSKTTQLRHILRTIEKKADITYTDLQANNVRRAIILTHRVKYIEFGLFI